VPYHAFAYSCCVGQDAVYHPGETVSLHWSVTPVVDSSPATLPVTLTVQLTGPFSDASEAKVGPSPGTTLVAAPIETTTAVGSSPVSTITFPVATAPGYYNLTFATSTRGSTVSGTSTILVEASGVG